MLGFVFGAVCLIGLVKVLRAGRHGRFGGWRHGRRWGRGWGPRAMLRGLFERLGTSTAQEKVITAAAEDIYASTEPLRDELRATRRDIAAALRGPAIDEIALGELFSRHDDVLRETRKRAVGALARVHDALDDKQRAVLADVLERGSRRDFHGGGPYRESVSI
jgi:uncharacterized membrane protein YccC